MSPETLFTLCNFVALAGWLLLVLAPRWKGSAPLISGVLLPGLLGLVYLALIVTWMGKGQGGFSSLAQVQLLFGNPWLLLAGWIHYLAFDLFIGSWEVRDAVQRGIPHSLVLPCLTLTFLVGPIGL